MTASEIVLKINDKNTKNKETNISIGYDITILINTNDINGAIKYVEDYFQCDKKIAIEAVKMWQEELGEPLSLQQKAHNQAVAKEALNQPKCPICNSTNIKKISSVERVTSIAMIGLFSKKINKSFKCNNCGGTF